MILSYLLFKKERNLSEPFNFINYILIVSLSLKNERARSIVKHLSSNSSISGEHLSSGKWRYIVSTLGVPRTD